MYCIYTLEDLSNAETVFETLDKCVIIYRMPNRDHVLLIDRQYLKSFRGRLHAFEEAARCMEIRNQAIAHAISMLNRMIKDKNFSREFLARYCEELSKF